MQEGRRGWAQAMIMQREGVVRVPFMHAHDKAIDVATTVLHEATL